MKSRQNKTFWILQIIAWNLPALNSWAKFLNPRTLNPTYILTEGFIVLITGIIASNWLRLRIKKHIDFENITVATFKKIGLYYLIASSIYFLLTIFFASIAFLTIQKHALNMSFLMFFSNVVNSFLFILIWLVFYISIKILIQLRAAKIKQLEIRSELKDAQLNILKGQINPHFMFNSLNNIRGLILEDKHKAREMLTRLSEMLRYSLSNNKVDTIRLVDEIEMVENYIALSKIQLENRLIFSLKMPKELNNCIIPPMIIQLLIENAIKHGIANNTKGGKIKLTINKNNSKLTITVSNTGTFAKHNQSTQIGIKNIKKRLKLMYKDKAQFSLIQDNNYVIATIVLPYHEK